MKIAVAGATGRVGRYVTDVLRTGGHDVVMISRPSVPSRSILENIFNL